MPVVQLQNDTGANLGSALGAAAGYFATQKQRKADKATAVADKQHTTAREDAAAADAHANIQSQIKQRDAGAADTAANALTAKTALGAYQANFPLLASATVGPDGKQLKGPALQAALVNLRNKAMNEGAFSDSATHEKNLGDFNTEIARVMQQNAPKLQDVTHGMQPLKPTDKPDAAVKHWMDAASKVANSDMDLEAKKTAIAMYQKNAADALARVPKPETPADTERARHDKAMEGLGSQRIVIQENRGTGGSGIGAQDLAERKREFDLTHNKDGSSKGRGETGGVTPQQRAAAIRGAVSTLGAQQIQPPNDPNFPAVLKQFGDPANRDAILNDPHMPPKTKAYLQQLDAMVP